MKTLLSTIRQCTVCSDLAHGCRPVVQLSASSRILIIGQAPGRKVHESGIPWNDSSGDTLRDWLSISKEQFYDEHIFSIMPMGFCYPGKGKSGDLPPRRECAPAWHPQIISRFQQQPLTLLIGQYAQRYYLHHDRPLTETVRNFQSYLPGYFPLPHPSPRNRNWLKVNPWFEQEVLPALRLLVQESVASK